MATSREMTAGRALPLIFNFTMPLLMGNLLQQTYSLVDAATGGGDVGSDCGGYEYSVWGYPADDAYTGYHIPGCLLLFIDNVSRSSLYFLL